MALGQLPVAAPVINVSQFLLDGGQLTGGAQGRRGLVAGQGRSVSARQGQQIPDRLVQLGTGWMSQRQRRSKMAEGFRVGEQRARVLAGQPIVLGCFSFVPTLLIVLSDLAGSRAQARFSARASAGRTR